MSHRGRLSMLANVVGKSMVQLFSEFEGDVDPESIDGQGDVKYHLGASGVRTHVGGKDDHRLGRVQSQPSGSRESGGRRHRAAQAGSPGRCRARTRDSAVDPRRRGDGRPGRRARRRMNLSQVEGYNTGGTIHLVINNQIGFTTNPEARRGRRRIAPMSRWCFGARCSTSTATIRKRASAPMQLAYDYRQRFHKDVVIDMVCYRKYGHNEADDPSYTQPILYSQNSRAETGGRTLCRAAANEGVITAEEVESVRREAQKKPLRDLRPGAKEQGAVMSCRSSARFRRKSMPADQPRDGGRSRGARADSSTASRLSRRISICIRS